MPKYNNSKKRVKRNLKRSRRHRKQRGGDYMTSNILIASLVSNEVETKTVQVLAEETSLSPTTTNIELQTQSNTNLTTNCDLFVKAYATKIAELREDNNFTKSKELRYKMYKVTIHDHKNENKSKTTITEYQNRTDNIFGLALFTFQLFKIIHETDDIYNKEINIPPILMLNKMEAVIVCIKGALNMKLPNTNPDANTLSNYLKATNTDKLLYVPSIKFISLTYKCCMVINKIGGVTYDATKGELWI